MNNTVITKEVYGLFKQYAYKMYLLSYQKQDPSLLEKYKEIIHNKLNNENFDKILNDTFLFPYDRELYNYMSARKLNTVGIEETMNEFNISYEFLIDKIKEYITYSYNSVMEKKLIDMQIVSKLTRHYNQEKIRETYKK